MYELYFIALSTSLTEKAKKVADALSKQGFETGVYAIISKTTGINYGLVVVVSICTEEDKTILSLQHKIGKLSDNATLDQTVIAIPESVGLDLHKVEFPETKDELNA